MSALAQIFTVRWSDLKFLPGIKQRGRERAAVGRLSPRDSSCRLLQAMRKRRRRGGERRLLARLRRGQVGGGQQGENGENGFFHGGKKKKK